MPAAKTDRQQAKDGWGRAYRRWAVIDAAVLKAVVAAGIEAKCGGRHREAERMFEIDSATLTHIKHERKAELAERTVRRLWSLVRVQDRDAFENALLPPVYTEALGQHRAWLERQARGLPGRQGERAVRKRVFLWHEELEWLPADTWAAVFDRNREMWDLIERADGLGCDLFDALLDGPEAMLIVDEESRVYRLLVSIRRILAPLLDAAEAGAVEPDGKAVTDAEFLSFLTHGIERERILFAAGAVGPMAGQAKNRLARAVNQQWAEVIIRRHKPRKPKVPIEKRTGRAVLDRV